MYCRWNVMKRWEEHTVCFWQFLRVCMILYMFVFVCFFQARHIPSHPFTMFQTFSNILKHLEIFWRFLKPCDFSIFLHDCSEMFWGLLYPGNFTCSPSGSCRRATGFKCDVRIGDLGDCDPRIVPPEGEYLYGMLRSFHAQANCSTWEHAAIIMAPCRRSEDYVVKNCKVF